MQNELALVYHEARDLDAERKQKAKNCAANDKSHQCWSCSTARGKGRGTQRIVSVNYLFGRPLIPYDFLNWGIFTSNFRDMGNLRLSVIELIKMSFRVPRKRSAKIFGKEIRPKVFGKWAKMP